MQNGRREVKISLSAGPTMVGTALSNLVSPKNDGVWLPYLVRVDFDAPPDPSADEIKRAQKRLHDFLQWMSTYNAGCWQVVERSS